MLPAQTAFALPFTSTVPWNTLLTSVVLYIVIPVALAQFWRKALLAKGQAAFDAAMSNAHATSHLATRRESEEEHFIEIPWT